MSMGWDPVQCVTARMVGWDPPKGAGSGGAWEGDRLHDDRSSGTARICVNDRSGTVGTLGQE